MEEVRKSLTKQEQVLLADFWENKDLLHALQKALLQRQFYLAVNTVASAPNWENVVANRGEITGSKWTNDFLKYNFSKVKKSRETAQQDKST